MQRMSLLTDRYRNLIIIVSTFVNLKSSYWKLGFVTNLLLVRLCFNHFTLYADTITSKFIVFYPSLIRRLRLFYSCYTLGSLLDTALLMTKLL